MLPFKTFDDYRLLSGPQDVYTSDTDSVSTKYQLIVRRSKTANHAVTSGKRVLFSDVILNAKSRKTSLSLQYPIDTASSYRTPHESFFHPPFYSRLLPLMLVVFLSVTAASFLIHLWHVSRPITAPPCHPHSLQFCREYALRSLQVSGDATVAIDAGFDAHKLLKNLISNPVLYFVVLWLVIAFPCGIGFFFWICAQRNYQRLLTVSP